MRVFELYQNGTSPDVSVRWYHPIGFVLFIIPLISLPILSMNSEQSIKSLNIDLIEFYHINPYFITNPDKLCWIDRKELLNNVREILSKG